MGVGLGSRSVVYSESFPTAELCFRCTVAVGCASHSVVSSICGLLAPESQPSERMGSVCDSSDCSARGVQTPCQLQVGHVCIHKLSVEDPARSLLTGLIERKLPRLLVYLS